MQRVFAQGGEGEVVEGGGAIGRTGHAAAECIAERAGILAVVEQFGGNARHGGHDAVHSVGIHAVGRLHVLGHTVAQVIAVAAGCLEGEAEARLLGDGEGGLCLHRLTIRSGVAIVHRIVAHGQVGPFAVVLITLERACACGKGAHHCTLGILHCGTPLFVRGRRGDGEGGALEYIVGIHMLGSHLGRVYEVKRTQVGNDAAGSADGGTAVLAVGLAACGEQEGEAVQGGGSRHDAVGAFGKGG